tara:strand:+ start:7622 stop:9292 length:1671 start_codon:yes stop_codon:yes gene_type:complete
MVGAKPVLVIKQQTRLSDFYPVSLPEVQTPQEEYWQTLHRQRLNPATTQSNLGDFVQRQLPEVSPLSAEQQLQTNLDNLRAKTENPENIVQQYIEDMRNKRHPGNVPRHLKERTENEIMHNVYQMPVSDVNQKFGRIRFPSKEFGDENIPEDFIDSLRNTPQFRDYFGRQTTLPEHFPSYHTEDWLDPKTGLVREGAVAPVTAVRRVNNEDIMSGMAQTGGGLIPLPNDSNENFESRSTTKIPLLMESQNPPLEHFQSGYFLTTPYADDLDRSVTTHSSNALVGVRGFGTPSGDIFQARPAGMTKEGATEAIVHSRIPPERLVPFRYFDARIKYDDKDKPFPSMESKPSFLGRNDLRNFFLPKRASDFRQAIGEEKDELFSRNQKFDYIRNNLPFMQFAPPEFDEMVDRHGMPAALTNEEKNRFLEAMEEDNKSYHTSMEVPERERNLQRKLELLRELGVSSWYNRRNNQTPPTLRDVTLPQTWGDPMASLKNAPPHVKNALIELFNRRFNTDYPTNDYLETLGALPIPEEQKQKVLESANNPKKTDFETLSELFG